MKKSVIIAIIALVVGALIFTIIMINSGSNTSNLPQISSAEDLKNLVSKIYEGKEDKLPNLDTQVIDITDSGMVSMFTGLESGKDLEYVVVSEPLMTSQAYSLVLVKVKDGVNADNVAKTMCENIDIRKWICVSAEQVYATSSGNVVMLIMSNKETATTIYESFKTLAGNVSEEYSKEEEQIELPEDMY